MNGTSAAVEMQDRARPGGWNTPCWAGTLDESGGVTPGEGQLLYGLIRALRPLAVLEVGTGYGHGTIHLAAGCKDNGRGHVHTVEIHTERRAAARENVTAAWLQKYVSFHELIPTLPVDLAFLDAGHTADDLRGYLARVNLRPGGVVVIHDAGYQNHAREIAAEKGWGCVNLPTESLEGMAILTTAEEVAT